MKWKTETNPRPGEQHIAEYFAVIPTALDDGYTVWLQKYYAIETWDDGTTSVGFGHWKTNRTSSTRPHQNVTFGLWD